MVGNAAFLGEGAPVFDIRTVDDEGDLNVCTVPQASALARALGSHWIVLLRGHGAVVVGETVRQCVRHAIIAETNARQQIEATILGPVRFLTASEIAYARRMKPKDADRAWRHWKRKAMDGRTVNAALQAAMRPASAERRMPWDAPTGSGAISATRLLVAGRFRPARPAASAG